MWWVSTKDAHHVCDMMIVASDQRSPLMRRYPHTWIWTYKLIQMPPMSSLPVPFTTGEGTPLPFPQNMQDVCLSDALTPLIICVYVI
jgi:hypothetical protein